MTERDSGQTYSREIVDRLSRGYKKSTVFSSVTTNSMNIIEENINTVGESMQNILAALEQLQATSGSTAGNTSKINDRIQELVENNRLMTEDVSESIHLLSINTSIEAAHFGKDAAGFGVIAREIKSLAGKTGSFTREISETIGRFRKSVDEINRKLEVFLELISLMHNDMNNYGSKFKDYEKSLSETGNQLAEITGAVHEGDLALNDGLNSLNTVSFLLTDTQNITATLNKVHTYLEKLFKR